MDGKYGFDVVMIKGICVCIIMSVYVMKGVVGNVGYKSVFEISII